MEKQKYLTKKFISKGTNSLYYQSSRKISLKILMVGLILYLIGCVYTIYAYRHGILDGKSVITAIYSIGLVLTVFILMPAIFITMVNHLFPKKITAFMQKFNEYNKKVLTQASIVLNDGEEIVFVHNKADSINKKISELQDEYDWLHDPVRIDTNEYQGRHEIISLMRGYVYHLSTVKRLLGEIDVGVKSLNQVTIEGLQKIGAEINNEKVFIQIGKVITARDKAVNYLKKLQKNITESNILQSEIDDYFTALTRPGITFAN